MSLKINVKMNAVTNLSDARYAAGMGVNLMGFCLDINHPSYIGINKMNAIAQWVSGIEMVFEFDTFDPELFNECIQVIVPQFVQVTNTEHWELLEKLAVPIIHKIRFSSLEDFLEILKSSPAHFILIEEITENQVEEHHEKLLEIGMNKKIIFGGELTATNANKIISLISPWGLAITGGEEERPGYRIFEDLTSLLEVLEEDI